MKRFALEIRVASRKSRSYLIRYFLSRILRLGPQSHQLMFGESEPISKSLSVLKKIDDAYICLVPHPRDIYLESHAFSPRYLIRGSDISVDTMTGVVTLPNGNFVVESSSWSKQDLELNVVHQSRYFQEVKVSGVENVLLASNGFYHWLLEDLPLYLRLLKEKRQQGTSLNTFVYASAPSYVRDFLSWMNIEGVNVQRFASFEEMEFISRGDDTGWPRREDINILRDTFAPLFLEKKLDKKIYISRIKSTRTTHYERELTALLAADGWTILYPETLSLTEQIQKISEARVLCGLHGAGLAGMVWMNSSATVIEISRATMSRACFARLANNCHLNYFWLSDDSMDILNLFLAISKLSETDTPVF